jgi:hypothetical protein
MKPKVRAQTAIEPLGAGDDKMNQIVAEVDRFFKTVHAEIEDWKFSMEDYGDGTRIFVRFQLHLNNSGAPPDRVETSLMASSLTETPVSGTVAPEPSAAVSVDGPVVSATAPRTEPSGTVARADRDIAHFVEHWRRTRDNNSSREFHREGAPYLDGASSWNGKKRTEGGAAPLVVPRRRPGRKPATAA